MFATDGRVAGMITHCAATFAAGTLAVGVVTMGTLTSPDQSGATTDVKGATTAVNVENISSSTIARIGSRGTRVIAIQRKVGVRGDGVYGRGTVVAVKAWQRRAHLPATGTVNRTTYDKMFPVTTVYHAGTQTIGYSTYGRPITLTVRGSIQAPRRAMFIGAIHGNERGGVPVTQAMARATPPVGVAYFVISYPNPDGAAYNLRSNKRNVDLNRNFPGWKRSGAPGSPTYPGTGALSEKESKVVYAAVAKIKPTAFVSYHQHMNLVDYCGGNKSAQATYAKQTRMRFTQLYRYPGSQATWLHSAHPRTTIMTVELPAHVSSSMISRHLAAAKYLAAHH